MQIGSIEALKAQMEKCIVSDCKDCPYTDAQICDTAMTKDALEYIESLEERIAIMQESMEALEKRCNALNALEQRCKTLEVLEKRNEPVKVRHLHNAKVTMHGEVTFTDECGNCGGYLVKTWKACPLCGRSVKWDGWQGKVINSLEYCISSPLSNDCNTCEYGGKSVVICERLIQEVLALLKEQDTSAWVSVKDRLPEQGKDVLVYIERNAYRFDEIIRKREIAIGWHIEGRWHVDGCSGVIGFYWRELPEPPKEVIE